ncbi:MAG: dihydropteroate synthase [Chloroflexi bacterium]|nr:dihydropteroate synthase [Chloroflexota bacterium]MDA1174604.1 dihydropteroate synthase [Chloroflexota bacterium]
MVRQSTREALRLGSYELPTSRTLIMGVLNVTPDSFSDGGLHLDAAVAIDHAKRMIEDGADIIDVGGESTRPGAAPVSTDEEIRRVVPVIEAIAGAMGVPVSIDTRNADVARRSIEAGAVMINDVTGLRHEAMLDVVHDTGASVTIMHMKGTPQTMATSNQYDDMLAEIAAYLVAQAGKAVAAGAQTVIIDPGIGFAKNTKQNLELLNHLNVFTNLGYPLLVGPSRKRFIGELTDAAADDRIPGTIAVVVKCVQAGADIVRVHDVAACKQAITITEAIERA